MMKKTKFTFRAINLVSDESILTPNSASFIQNLRVFCALCND